MSNTQDVITWFKHYLFKDIFLTIQRYDIWGSDQLALKDAYANFKQEASYEKFAPD